MILADLVWGAPSWLMPAAIMAAVLLLLVVWSYLPRGPHVGVRMAAAALKACGVIALALCLIEPLFSGVRPRPGANLFLMLADNSKSLQLRDPGQRKTRGEKLAEQLDETSEWQTRLSQDFDVRRYLFDTRVRPVSTFADVDFDGNASALAATLTTVAGRYRDRPIAGMLLFSDGNATDWHEEALAAPGMPPVYAVALGTDQAASDISLTRVSVSQTNFEASPVTIMAEAMCQGYAGQRIVFQLLDESGQPLQRHTLPQRDAGEPLVHRFLLKPEQTGISFYQVRVFAEDDERHLDRPERTAETTLANNSRLVMVDRGGGPYRVLYVSGRPNWDLKFLRRAIQEDDELQLVALLRIASREPKFTFRGHIGERTNPLYRGFDNQEDEEAEQYDQPVLLRLGTQDQLELRDGFPQAADQLFRYHALILDDLEAEYFTQDQMSLIQEFVSRRGGGFLMLGGRDAFAGGDYRRTPIGELLPVYADPPAEEVGDEVYRLSLTRDGWIQPWVRLRSTEPKEQERLDDMPGFRALNRVGTIKPGATVLAHVTSSGGDRYPAVVAQRFGKGRAAALLIADMWRWQLRRARPEEDDLAKSWRQTLRWLVAEVPGRVEVETRRKLNEPSGTIEIAVLVRDEQFQPLENATVKIQVQTPEGRSIELTAAASDRLAGEYLTEFTPREPGGYRARVTAAAADGSEVGQPETGWASQPDSEEFQTLRPNRALLKQIAETTSGEVLELHQLAGFVHGLPNRKIPITEPWIYPLWHQWSVLILAVSCLVGEWGLRRWKGLP